MLKVGIIGSGFGVYGLLPAFNAIEDCQVVSVCGKNTKRLLHYNNEIGSKKIYSDWRVMLDNQKLDAIALAVTPSVQYEIAKIAIEKDIHIFAEKPLAANVIQAKELLNLATKYNITHAVDFIFPEIDQWQKVKQLLDNKTFGQLRHISVNWDFLSFDIKNEVSSWKTDVKEGGGALSFYFSHSLYYLEYYAGEILDLKSLLSYSEKSANGGETGVEVLLTFKNNVTGHAHLSCNSQGLHRHQILFQCDKGTIILENEDVITRKFVITLYAQGGEKKVIYSQEKEKKSEDERVAFVKKLAVRFINACINNQQMTPSFKEGVRVQELIEKIRQNN